ncbi:MAG TPA: multiheme c-type cytochrome [Chitinophagales bacterium]|nr:multiheme c-type cytochrome [Chitinophagales bacterium]
MFTEEYKAKSRAEKIQECAKCHPREFENEQLGPHANAFTQVREYVFQRAQNSPYFPPVYVKTITDSFTTICTRCHTGKNLYENNLKATLTSSNVDSIWQHHSNEITAKVPARENPDEWLTGIDCLTCHGANDNVITHIHSKADRGAPCRPAGNAFFSSEKACITCHLGVVSDMVDNIHNPAVTKSQTCMSCHSEYDENGQFTHYIYWRHDPPHKKRAAVRGGIFDDFTVKVQKKTRHEYALSFEWANKRAPHRITETEDIFMVVSVTSQQSKIIVTDTVRVNDKAKSDNDIQLPIFKGEPIPGSPVGYTFLPTDSAFRKTVSFVMPGDSKSLTVNLTGFIKSQYWLDDAEAEKVYERTEVF